jgi:hypothetical protein
MGLSTEGPLFRMRLGVSQNYILPCARESMSVGLLLVRWIGQSGNAARYEFSAGRVDLISQEEMRQKSRQVGIAPVYFATLRSGTNYSSCRISLVDVASTSGRAQSMVGRYPDKSTVRVYYNPSNFAEAVLEPGRAGGINVLYLVGGVFAAGGLFFLIMSLTGHVHTNH